VLFAVNTGLRPDEAWHLEFRDVTIVDDENLGKTILGMKYAADAAWDIARVCLVQWGPLSDFAAGFARRAFMA
jgi:hypothetical protein